MLPKLGLSAVTKQNEVSVSPRGSNPLQDETPQNPLSARIENSFTSGQLMQSLSGGFMALGMKELKDDLRLSKRAEQLAKDKLLETKKQLEQTEEAFQKYKVDADARLDNLKTENSMLQLSLKHMHDQNEVMERSSTQSNTNQDVFKIVEDYSKQIEQKSKEIEDLLIGANIKKTKHQQLKKVNTELEQKLHRLQSKLDNMTKFCRIFVKSIKLQNNSLKDTVQTQQRDFSNVFKNLKTEIFDQIQSRFLQSKLQYDQLLKIERENVSNLKQQILKLDQSTSEKVKHTAQETQHSMQKEIEQLKTKNEKLKQKMTSMRVSQSETDEQSQAHQVDVLNLNLANVKQKYELQLLEKDNLVQGLRETIQTLQSRENILNNKLESVDSKSRQEYQRLIEMYEGSSRFKEIRDLYEEKVNQRDQQLLETKQALVKCQVQLEYANESIETFKQKEWKHKNKLAEAETKYKLLQENALAAQKQHSEQSIQAQNTFNESAKVAQATFQQEFQRLSLSYDADLKTLQSKLSIQHQEDIQKLKIAIAQEYEDQIKTNQEKLVSCEELLKKQTEKVYDNNQVVARVQDAISQLQEDCRQKEAQWEKQKEQLMKQIAEEQIEFQAQKSLLIEQIKASEQLQQKYQQSYNELTNNLENQKQNQREELLALNWEIEDLRKKQVASPIQTRKVQAQEVYIQTEITEEFKEVQTENFGELKVVKREMISVGVDAIIINSSMEYSEQKEEFKTTSQDILTQEVKVTEKSKPPTQFGHVRPGMPSQPRAAPKRPMGQKPVMEQQVNAFPQQNQVKPQEYDTPKQEESVKTSDFVTTQTSELSVESKRDESLAQQSFVETQKTQPVQNIQEESKQKATENQNQQKDTKSLKEPQAQIQEEAAPSRFYSIISSFIGLLSRRKQAYTGKPASAMYYSKEKNRWIIAGEEESEEDVPAPPPPKAKTVQQVENKPEQKPETTKSEPVGLNSLTQPVFGGALANRNRGKPKTATTGGPKLPSFPVNPTQSVFNVEMEKENPKQTQVEIQMEFQQHEQVQNSTQAIKSDQNETELDISAYTARDYLSQTMLQNQENGNSENLVSKQLLLQTEAEIKQYKERENDWKLKHNQQNERIQSLKSQIQHLQSALQDEKQHSQQTIVELENFSNEMTEAGNHHQKQLTELTTELTNCQAQLNYLETSKWQVEESYKLSEEELEQARQELRNLKQKCYSLEVQVQINEIHGQMQEDEKIVANQTISRSVYDQLEDKCETLRWQLAIENQKVQKVEDYCRHLQSESQRLAAQLTTFKSTNREQSIKMQDLLDKFERERETNKEQLLRYNQEKEQLQEQLRKQANESQQHLRRLENEKQSKQQDFFKLIQEKDTQHQQSIEAIETQKAIEIQKLQQQLESQTAQQQNQLRLEQSRIKKQINSLESVLSKKDEDLLAVIGKNEEAQQELQTMSQMRHKLNDHIVYLQNEIRKRDELLEDGSDFEDDTGLADDSYCSNGQASSSQQEQASSKKKQFIQKQGTSKHLEDSRNQIKQLIEGKSQLSKEVNSLSQQIRSLNAGLRQILSLYDWDNNSSELFDSSDLTQIVIAKFFELRNKNETMLMEMEQKIEHLTIQVDNASTLTFEVELLTGERDLLQNELNELSSIKDQLASELESTTATFNDQLNARDQEIKVQDDRHRRQISILESNQARQSAEFQQNTNEMRQKLAKRDDLINQLEQQVKSSKVDQDLYLNQVSELQKKVGTLNAQRTESSNRYEIEIEALQASKIELENQVLSLKQSQTVQLKQISDLEENVQEKHQLLTQSEQRLAALNNDFENVAQAFVQKKEAYKQQIQKLKLQVSEQQENSQAVTELKAQLSQADSLIQQMQSETETIVRKMQEKKSQREQKLKDRITELTQEIEQYQLEIEKQRQQASLNQSEVLKEMQNDLIIKDSSIQELQKVVASHKIAYQALQSQQEDDMQKQQTNIKVLQDQVTLLENKVKQHEEQVQSAASTYDSHQDYSRQLNDQIALLNNQIRNQQIENVQLQEKLDQTNQNVFQIESQYQQESQKLTDVFKHKQSQQREKSQQLKQELRDIIGRYTELESQNQIQGQRIVELSDELQHLQQEKLNLSQSLDLTKIQTNKEVSQMQIERKLIESEQEQKLSLINQQITALLQQIDPEVAQTIESIEQSIEIIHEWLKNAAEVKRSLQQLVQDKDEITQENQSLHYKIQILSQENDKIMQQLNLSENANLAKIVKTLEEERQVLQNDFVIQMDNMSQENSILKEKLSMLTKTEKDTTQGDQSKQEKKSSINYSTTYKLEQDQQAKPVPAKNTSFLASLFLTNSEL